MRLNDILDSGLKVLQPEGGCHSCPRAKKDFVPATLTDSDLIIVGEAPGATEVEEGEGFTGKSGRLLRNYLDKYGITEYSLTNTIHCRPPDNRNPHKKEVSCCLNQFVINEVKGHQTVLLTGKVPAETFFPNSTYKKIRGHVTWHPDFPNTRFFGILHPAYILRRQDKGPEFEEQIARLSRVLQEDPSTPPWEIIRGDSPQAIDAFKEVLANDTYSFDIETTGLESWHPDKEIESFAVCATTDKTVFFHKNDPYWDEALHHLGKSVEKTSTFIIAHNAGFDLEWLEERLGVHARCQMGDTQVLYYLLYMGEDYRKARMPSLKFLTAEELDGYRYLVTQPHLCNDPDLLAKYNTEDIVRTLQLFRKGFPQLNEKQRDLFLRVGSPSSLATRRLAANGLFIDLDYAETLAQELREERDEILHKWEKEDPEFDPDEHISGNGFIRYVYQIKDNPVIKRTKKSKQPATDKDTIKELIRDHDAPYLQNRLDIQNIEKQLSTFVEPYSSGKVIDPFTDRVHGDYLNTFTRTGRTSSRSPNMQNWSRDPRIRNLAAVPEGKFFVEADLSQIELRICMSLANDPVGIEAYLSGGDLHAQTAQKMAEQAGRDEWNKEDRTNAKVTNFGLLFGGDAGTVRRYAFSNFGIDLSWKEAEAFHRTFFSTYAELPGWHQSVIDELRNHKGVIETALGHRRYFDNWNHPKDSKREHAERSAINTVVQSNNAYMTLYILCLVQQEIRERNLYKEGIITTGTVHDSILAEVPEELFGEFVEITRMAVDKTEEWVSDWFQVPLVMDFAKGKRWGELEELGI